MIQELLRNRNHAFQRITENNIALQTKNVSIIIIRTDSLPAENHTGETVTPPTSTGTSLAPGFASAPDPTVDVPFAQTYINQPQHPRSRLGTDTNRQLALINLL